MTERGDPFADDPSDAVRHSKERALDDVGFERLMEGAVRVEDDYYRRQCRLAVVVLGRLGLRCSELAHMRNSWIDERRQVISIPAHQPCDKGRGGSTCGSCTQKAKQRIDHADADVPVAEAVASYWRPKTEAAKRDVYYGHSPRAEIAISDFFEKRERWPVSVQGVNRRVKRAARNAAGVDPDELTAHPLRATAATHLSGRGLELSALMQYFGWADARVAMDYIATNADATARQIETAHSR